MIIAGIDYSKNSPGVMISNIDKNFEIINTEYRGFTSVKKTTKLDSNLIFYHKNEFNNDIEKAVWMRDHIIEFIEDVDYCAIEGYALAAKGKVFDIAEATMCTKLGIYEGHKALRIYEPSTIKLFATGNGNSAKVEMGDAYVKYEEKFKPDLSHLTPYKPPSEDLVDAYFCMKLLQTELKLRYGIVELRDLSLETIKIFNRVTKANPENILVRNFIIKN